MPNSSNRVRRSIRYEAARIMADEDVRDYRKAKQKACTRLGVSTHRSIPTNLEIEDALEEQLSIFSKDRPAERQIYLETARVIMDAVLEYRPKLTGAALTGVITPSRPVEIHLFPPTYEEICALLDDFGMLYSQIEKRKRFAGRRHENIPGFELTSTDVSVELFCFLPGTPYPPLSPISGKAIQSISRKKVGRLLS